MRTITKIRLPLYTFGAVVLAMAILNPPLWGMFMLLAIYLAVGFWAGRQRCPGCGEVAGLVVPKGFWRPYISMRGICVKCGADFFKV